MEPRKRPADAARRERPGVRPRRGRGKQKKRERLVSLLRALLMALFTAVFFISSYKVSENVMKVKYARDSFSDLAAIREQGSAAAATPAPTAAPTPLPSPSAEETSPVTPEPVSETSEPEATPDPPPGTVPLPQYAELYEMNHDLYGWLIMDAVGIDYPVMYTPEDPDFYLDRDFYGKDIIGGTPYIDGRCPAEGHYFLIYGHLMQDKSIFGRLPELASEELWRENPRFRFDTVFEEREYEIVAAFYSRLYAVTETGVFRYYYYFDLSDEAVFNEYMREVRKAQLYDTGVSVSYGDDLVALSTCSEHVPNGRFVLLAKRVKD